MFYRTHTQLVASKFMYDDGTDDEVYNDEWSASSHMDVKHLKKLEAQFLHALDWRALVTAQEFQQMLNYMEARWVVNVGGVGVEAEVACVNGTVLPQIKCRIF